MAFKIITADERLSEKRGVKALITGPAGIGKTSLLWTLDPPKTLFLDLEAGDLAVQSWPGDAVRPRTWQECRDFAVYIGGLNPANEPGTLYSQQHYEAIVSEFGDPGRLDRYDTVFIDSITVAGRLCLKWAQQQPEAFSDRTGKPDTRGMYGLLGRQMMEWLGHLQHTRGKSVVFVGILEEITDDFNRRTYRLQIDGQKTGLELPGIVDQVISMVQLTTDEGAPYRAFVCQTLNTWGYPAKDRSGRLDMIEEPHLGRLMTKIKGPAKPASERLDTTLPAPTPSTPNTEAKEAAE